jgi:Mitochondrial carrier protein.
MYSTSTKGCPTKPAGEEEKTFVSPIAHRPPHFVHSTNSSSSPTFFLTASQSLHLHLHHSLESNIMVSTTGSVLLAPSPDNTKYDFMYYLKGAAAGGICCSITHGALTPVDVVKTRVQLDPIKVR